jgi:hypothetical protein
MLRLPIEASSMTPNAKVQNFKEREEMSLIRGRFQKEADEAVSQYTVSLPFDWRLYSFDIAGSIAHARMLGKQGIISANDSKTIVRVEGHRERNRAEIDQNRNWKISISTSKPVSQK